MFAMVRIGAIWHKTAELIPSAQIGDSVRHCSGEKGCLACAQQYHLIVAAFRLGTHWHLLILYYVKIEEGLEVKG